MEGDRSLIGEIGEAFHRVHGRIGRDTILTPRDLDSADVVGEVIGGILLAESLRTDPAWIPLQGEGRAGDEGEHPFADLPIVSDQIGLREARLREQDLVWIRDLHPAQLIRMGGGPSVSTLARHMSYDHQEIERRWQEQWEADGLYRAKVDWDKPKH